jgi:hypothetical protein
MASPCRLIAGLSLAGIISCVGSQPILEPITPVQSRMHADIAYLAGPELAGRLSGTPGNDSAAAFIARRYSELGIPAAFKTGDCKCDPSFLQFFTLGRFATANLDVVIRDKTQNVGAVVGGTDSLLRGEYVVIGAHYDHLGRSTTYARDMSTFRQVHPGADDNASGTAAVMELARRFAEKPARRSVIFVNFSGEELGLIGSQAFVEHTPVMRDSIVTMVNLDMVGRLRDNRLILFSGEDHGRFPIVVDSVERFPPAMTFHLRWEPGTQPLSDQASFADFHIPVLGLFTDYHADYHRASDVVGRINFQGLETVVDFTERFVRAIADGNDRPN